MSHSELILAAVLTLLALPGAQAAVTVDCAYYHVDVGGSYAWTEGAPGLADFAKTHKRAGTLKIYVRNEGTAPAQVDATALNGTSLDELRDSEGHDVIWWRTWPSPVPAGGLAEISVRLRYPVDGDAVVTLQADGEAMQATVPQTPPSFRIETVGWVEGGRKLFLVAEQLRDEPARISRVLIDGEDVTGRSRILAAGFHEGLCPIEVDLPEAMAPGSFHTYKLVADGGAAVACTLRTLDEFMRLGMYGAGDLEADIKIGINTASHFGAQSRWTLDRYAAYGLQTAFHVNANLPAPEVRGHPGVYGYILHDEPDCWDYGAKEWPAALRIGYHGPDIVKHTQQCAQADPSKPVLVTVDLTYKPANYYVYAQIPDIVTPDCYPIAIGVPLAWVRETTEACRKAAGPRRVEAVPQVCFEDRQNTEMKYRRPPFEREVIIQYLYALGAGARGFSGWEWFDEKGPTIHFYGAPNYPDVLQAVGETFRRFKLVQPLILQAHPAQIAKCDRQDVWVRSLVCGSEAMLLVVVNDDYEQLAKDFVVRPKSNVEISIPDVPWMDTGYVGVVGDGEVDELTFSDRDDGARFTLPALDAGELILVASDPEVAARLLEGYEEAQRQAGADLLAGARHDASRSAQAESLKRYILGRYEPYALTGATPLSAYGAQEPAFMNPSGDQYPALEWWTDKTPRGGEWKVSIPADRAGVKHTVYFQMSRWWGGGYLRFETIDADGNTVVGVDRPTWEGSIPNVSVTFPTAGEYTVRILQAGEGKPGGRLARTIFVVPDTAPPLPKQAW